MSAEQFPRTFIDRCACGCKYWENSRCIDCGEKFRVESVFTTVKEAAEILGVKYSEIMYEAGRSGGTYQGFWVQKIDGRVYIATDDVESLLRARMRRSRMVAS